MVRFRVSSNTFFGQLIIGFSVSNDTCSGQKIVSTWFSVSSDTCFGQPGCAS